MPPATFSSRFKDVPGEDQSPFSGSFTLFVGSELGDACTGQASFLVSLGRVMSVTIEPGTPSPPSGGSGLTHPQVLARSLGA